MKHLIHKIVSGGQTGVDRAALDAALEANIPCGGWCPKGRLAEDGVIPSSYPLTETKTARYSERTRLNVKDSDGTLIIVMQLPLNVSSGTALTVTLAKKQRKPVFIVELNKLCKSLSIINWLRDNNIRILNVAGPRESQSVGIYERAYYFLQDFLIKTIEGHVPL